MPTLIWKRYPTNIDPNRPMRIYNTNMDFLTKAYTASAAGIEDTAPDVINAIAAPEVIPISIRPEINGMAAYPFI